MKWPHHIGNQPQNLSAVAVPVLRIEL